MSDFSFIQNNINQVQLPWSDIDIDTKTGDFLQDNFLQTSMMISLFSNAPANTDELNRFNANQFNKTHNRGWFGSTYANVEYGSKLWLLERERRNQETLNLAQQYCEQSLQWIINEGISSKIDVECSWNADVLVINIEVHREFDENVVKRYSYVWDNMLAPKDVIVDPIEYNILWKRFDNNIKVGIFNTITQPVDDVGYICLSGSLVKAYSASETVNLPDIIPPTFIRQCNDGVTTWPPTDEAHLVGMPYSDNFTGTNCNSETIGDTNWLLKGMTIVNDLPYVNFTQSITAGDLVLSGDAASGGTKQVYLNNSSIPIGSGDEFQIGFNLTSITAPVGNEYRAIQWNVVLGATLVRFITDVNPTVWDANRIDFGSEYIDLNGIISYPVHQFELRRDASGILTAYFDGILRGTSAGVYNDALTYSRQYFAVNNQKIV